jgi:hypothetical protein
VGVLEGPQQLNGVGIALTVGYLGSRYRGKASPNTFL